MKKSEYDVPKTQVRGEPMQSPEDVAAMLRLKACVRQSEWVPYASPKRSKSLERPDEWLKARFLQHAGNAAVVLQDLQLEHGFTVSLRTVERACAPLRQALAAEAKATVRFETPPGKQLQIDFGSRQISIDGESIKVFLFVATLGYSRRHYVHAFRHERQSAGFAGLEGAFRHFGGVPEQVLLDNARALVDHHNVATREVVFNERLAAFARYWGFRPLACAP